MEIAMTIQDLAEELVLRGCRKVDPAADPAVDLELGPGDWIIWEPQPGCPDIQPSIQICVDAQFDLEIVYCQHCGLLEQTQILDASNAEPLMTLPGWPGWDTAMELGGKAVELLAAHYDRFIAWQNRSGRHITNND